MSFIIYSRADSCPHKPCTRMTPVFSVTVRVVAGLLLDHPPAAPCEKSRTRFPRRAHLLSLCPGTSTELHSATRNGTPPPKCWALGPSSGHRQLASHALSCWLISASMCVSRHACGHSEVLPPPAPQWLWPSSARVWPARFVWAASFSGRVCCTPRGAAVPRDGGGAGPAEGALVPGGRSAGSCGGGGAGLAEGARVPAGGAWPGTGFRRKSQFLQSGYRKPATAMAPDGQGLALWLVLVGGPPSAGGLSLGAVHICSPCAVWSPPVLACRALPRGRPQGRGPDGAVSATASPAASAFRKADDADQAHPRLDHVRHLFTLGRPSLRCDAPPAATPLPLAFWAQT